jgi:sugar diacid utilization regulator
MQHKELEENQKNLKQQIKEFRESVRISNENLLFQKSVHEKSHNERRRSLQPILKVIDVEKNIESPSKKLTIKIKNIGQEILDIKINEDHHIKDIKDQSVWKQFETKEIIISYNESELPIFDTNNHDDPRYQIKDLYIYFSDTENNRYKISLRVYCVIYIENSFHADLGGFGDSLYFEEIGIGY